MHAAKLSNPETKPARLYAKLLAHYGWFWDAGELARAVGTTCLSTHISEIRQQLVDEELIHDHRGKKHYYALMSSAQAAEWRKQKA